MCLFGQWRTIGITCLEVWVSQSSLTSVTQWHDLPAVGLLELCSSQFIFSLSFASLKFYGSKLLLLLLLPTTIPSNWITRLERSSGSFCFFFCNIRFTLPFNLGAFHYAQAFAAKGGNYRQSTPVNFPASAKPAIGHGQTLRSIILQVRQTSLRIASYRWNLPVWTNTHAPTHLWRLIDTHWVCLCDRHLIQDRSS